MDLLPLAFGLGATELIWIAVIVLVLFGGTKIPELMRGVGRGMGELQKGLDEGRRTMHRAMHEDNAREDEEERIRSEAPSKDRDTATKS